MTGNLDPETSPAPTRYTGAPPEREKPKMIAETLAASLLYVLLIAFLNQPRPAYGPTQNQTDPETSINYFPDPSPAPTIRQLYLEAQRRKLPRYKSMNKSELMAALSA